MSSNKRKISVAKAQASGAKLKDVLKQKTLFDSFIAKSTRTVKADTNQPPMSAAELAEIQTAIVPLTDTTIEPSNSSDTPIPLLDITTPEAELIPSSPQILDLTQTPDLEIGASVTHKLDLETRRSPSIVILDDGIRKEIFQTISSQIKKPQAKVDGHTRDQPIVIPSSPIRGPSTTSKPNATVHPFFMSRAKPPVSSVQLSTKNSKTVATNQGPPYPNNESQHVRGPQTAIQCYDSSFPKRPTTQPKQMIPENMNYKFLIRPDIVVDEPNDTWIHPTADTPHEPSKLDVPPEHVFNHPAIARLVDDGLGNLPTSSRPWAEKWRPSCAKEALGNESSATYLRNWLRALELQLEGVNNLKSAEASASLSDGAKGKVKASNRGAKRARVVRTVDKRRKKSRLDSDEEDDNWIAYSDESEEEVNYEEIDEFGDILLPEVPASSQSSTTHDLPPSSNENIEQDLGQLHNTILLSGPSGSGKTTSVYACSEELGWDVFEVYPGVGRRNGANIDNLVGEVGKNHLVLQNRRNGDVLKTLLSQKKNAGTRDASSHESLVASYSPRKKSGSKDALDPWESNIDTKPIRQSLILLEEVDILYKEDVNFWTTVIRIIKECKRPVICTCNDISLVPVQDLPLQSIIQFEPCPTDIAVSYLQAVCSAEGYSVDRDLISRLYSYPLQGEEPAKMFSPTYPPATPDLRRTINSLQIKCTTIAKAAPEIRQPSNNLAAEYTSGGASEAHPLAQPVVQGKARAFTKKSEFLSFLDGELTRGPSDIVTTTELASYLPSGDDEIGHTILYDRHATDRHQFGHHDRQEDMICSAVEISSKLLDVNVIEDDRSRRAMEQKCKKSRHEQLTVLQDVCTPTAWTRGLSLEYLPYLRQMVESEDIEEARAMEKRGRTGRLRNTRNSTRSEYVRTIELSVEGRRVVGTSGLSIVEGA